MSAFRTRRVFTAAAMISPLAFMMAGCSLWDRFIRGPEPPGGEVVRSAKQRDTSPAVPQADLDQLVTGNSEFAFDLYQILCGQDGNLFYSPYSISLALAMTYAGARNETEQQMTQTLRFTLDQTRLHPAFNSLDLTLNRRGEGAAARDGEPFRLTIVNALWGQTGYTFLDEFLDTLAVNYDAGMRLLDFINASEQARVTINDWVSYHTENRINDLIPPGVIDSYTRLVLTNAIYFNAAWKYQFKKSDTRDETFHLLDGSEIMTAMMHQTADFGYAQAEGCLTVELPYDGDELSMVILLPEAGQFQAFEQSLDAQKTAAILDGIHVTEVNLTMPKFTYESSFGLSATLAQMGMPIAFTEQADFSGMDGKRDLLIQDVIHKAFVLADETGTEAAAATAVIVGLTAAPAEPVVVRIDRPFVFLIRDVETKAILFIGRVTNPGA